MMQSYKIGLLKTYLKVYSLIKTKYVIRRLFYKTFHPYTLTWSLAYRSTPYMWAEYRNAGVAMRTADQEIRPGLFPVSPQAGWGGHDTY